MIGLDTNVLVRYIVRDDPDQTEAATRLIESSCTAESPGFISHLVLAELIWVLVRGYGYPKPAVVSVLAKLLATVELSIQDSATAWAALRAYETGGADFADYLIGRIHMTHGCSTTYTFDQRAARSGWHSLVR